MKQTGYLIAAFGLGCIVMFAAVEFGRPVSEMLPVAFNQDYEPEAFVPMETHLVATIEEVDYLCGGGTALKYGCLKRLGKTVMFVCLKSKEFDCKAHEWDHLVRGPDHASN